MLVVIDNIHYIFVLIVYFQQYRLIHVFVPKTLFMIKLNTCIIKPDVCYPPKFEIIRVQFDINNLKNILMTILESCPKEIIELYKI